MGNKMQFFLALHYYFFILQRILLFFYKFSYQVFLAEARLLRGSFLGGDMMMMLYHQEYKHQYIRLDVYIQADMRMLRFESQDYSASFSINKFLQKGKLAALYGKQYQGKQCKRM